MLDCYLSVFFVGAYKASVLAQLPATLTYPFTDPGTSGQHPELPPAETLLEKGLTEVQSLCTD